MAPLYGGDVDLTRTSLLRAVVAVVVVAVQDLMAVGLELTGLIGKHPQDIISHTYSCECSSVCNEIQRRNSKSSILLKRMEDLVNLTATTIDGDVVSTPGSDVVVSGLVCKSRSILVADREVYRNSYSTLCGKSAESFRLSMDVIKQQRRLLLVLSETVAHTDLNDCKNRHWNYQ